MIAISSPSAISRLTPRSAATSIAPMAYVLETPTIWMLIDQPGHAAAADARHTGPAAGRRAGGGALDHELIALFQPIGDLDERVALHAGGDHAGHWLAVFAHDLDDLLAALAAHRPQRRDQHVVLFVDDDRRGGGQTARQHLIARFEADRHRVGHHALRQRPVGRDRDDFAAERAARDGVERERRGFADGDPGDVGLVDGDVDADFVRIDQGDEAGRCRSGPFRPGCRSPRRRSRRMGPPACCCRNRSGPAAA